MRLEQAIRPFVNAPRADEAATRERCRRDATDARPARMHAFVPGAVGAVFRYGGRGAARETLREGELLRIEVEQFARRHRAAEVPGDAGGVIPPDVHQAVRRDAHARGDFNGQCVGGEHILAGGIDMFAHAQRAGKRAATGMHDCARMRVVVIESMRENAVQQHRIAQRQFHAHADNGILASLGNTEQSG